MSKFTKFKSTFKSTLCAMVLLFGLVIAGCAQDVETSAEQEIEELGQQIGDIMASIDESGGSSGSFASLIKSSNKMMARIEPDLSFSWKRLLLPPAHAATCGVANTFSGCINNVNTRDFASCTIGAATFSGTVTLTFDDALVDNTCALAADGHSITRSPNFTVTGRRGATLNVTKTGALGQKLTKTANLDEFKFSNDGIRRAFVNASNVTIFDFSTQTTADITVTGTNRLNRVMTGGNLRVTNNLSNVTCDMVPNTVTWNGSCNCPTSGTWTGTCSSNESTSIVISGCGTASLTVGENTENIVFDRCHSI